MISIEEENTNPGMSVHPIHYVNVPDKIIIFKSTEENNEHNENDHLKTGSSVFVRLTDLRNVLWKSERSDDELYRGNL